MAGILDEFDEATPLKRTYCSILTQEEYEEQGSNFTEQALSELVHHLDTNSSSYKKVLKKKKLQEAEEEGVLSFVKVKLWSFFAGEDAVCSVSDAECEDGLKKLKDGMMKAFDYSQESKGRRCSKRLQDRRLRALQQQKEQLIKAGGTPLRHSNSENIPPAPPPPPPPLTSTPLKSYRTPEALARRPLSERKGNKRIPPPKLASDSVDCDAHKKMMQQLNGPSGRTKLRKTLEMSPGGTPRTGWPKKNFQPDMMPFFNAKLLDKFKNIVTSPVSSPNLASPGTFESPVQDS